MEDIVAGWLLEMLHLPAGASVGFVTGAHMANFTCLAAARHEVLRRVGWNVEAHGLQRAPRVTIVVGRSRPRLGRSARCACSASARTRWCACQWTIRGACSSMRSSARSPASMVRSSSARKPGTWAPAAAIRSQGWSDRRAHAWCVGARRRCVRVVGGGRAGAGRAGRRYRHRRLVDDGRAQVAERPLRLRPGDRRASRATSGIDGAAGVLPDPRCGRRTRRYGLGARVVTPRARHPALRAVPNAGPRWAFRR